MKLEKEIVTLYHGSERIIEAPQFGVGKTGNDYGLGFYCTESEELAKEWSVRPGKDGFANRYTLDTRGLNILNLNSPEYTVLNWIAVLVCHRQFRIKAPIAHDAVRYLRSRFYVPVESYDVVTGYRADDSYFDIAESFLNNTITVEELSEALLLGKLGEQVVLKSEEAFNRLTFQGYSEASGLAYSPKRLARDKDAETRFASILEKRTYTGLYMNTILAEKIGNDDARLPRNIA